MKARIMVRFFWMRRIAELILTVTKGTRGAIGQSPTSCNSVSMSLHSATILAHSKMSPRRCMCQECVYTYILHAVDWLPVALESRHLLFLDVVELSNNA